MPELPEVQALSTALTDRLARLRCAAFDITAVSALKTADPPYTEVTGMVVDHAVRHGKFLALGFSPDTGEPVQLWLVLHLARAGWLKLATGVSATPPRPGRGPLMARLTFVNADGEPTATLDMTEAGTRKGSAIYLVRDPFDVPGIAALGPDALDLDEATLAGILAGAGHTRLKNALRDQRLIAGIGNAYSDDILQSARLSPYAPADALAPDEVAALATAIHDVLDAALTRAGATDPTTMKAEKKSGLAIHGRTGLPCPTCGTIIAEVALADSSFQYCPQCQTGGKPLADRRMSRLLK